MKLKAQRKKPLPNCKRCRNCKRCQNCSTAERKKGKAKKGTSAAKKRLEMQTDQLKGERDNRRRAEKLVEERETIVRLLMEGYGRCDICQYGAYFGGECVGSGCESCEKERCQCRDCVNGSNLKLAEHYRTGEQHET